jgi:hypothetical protein
MILLQHFQKISWKWADGFWLAGRWFYHAELAFSSVPGTSLAAAWQPGALDT